MPPELLREADNLSESSGEEGGALTRVTDNREKDNHIIDYAIEILHMISTDDQEWNEEHKLMLVEMI